VKTLFNDFFLHYFYFAFLFPDFLALAVCKLIFSFLDYRFRFSYFIESNLCDEEPEVIIARLK